MATATPPLIEELEGYRKQYEAAKKTFRGLLEGLDDDQFNWRPQENSWSMAECIDHLVMIGTFMNKSIDEALEKADARSLKSNGPFKYGPIGNWFVRAVSGTEKARKRKFKAPATYTPTSNHSISRLDAAFNELQNDYIERLQKANGYDLARIKMPSPALNILKLSLGQWFALLAGHQERHLIQAQGVRDLRESSGGGA